MDAKQALDFAINLLELRQTSERKDAKKEKGYA